MAFTTTTASSAIAAQDTSIAVTSATGFAAGSLILVDQEMMQVVKSYVSGTTIPVLRGQDGTVQSAHKVSANVTVGLASDFSTPVGQTTTTYGIIRGRTLTSYSATGAIALPTPGSDAVAILNGTSALAMTLANPTKDMDGCCLTIIGNGKSASTVTVNTSGIGNGGASYDVVTFQNAGQVSLPLMAANGIWVALNTPFTGTSTALSVAIA